MTASTPNPGTIVQTGQFAQLAGGVLRTGPESAVWCDQCQAWHPLRRDPMALLEARYACPACGRKFSRETRAGRA